jgi:succinate-semialdehyde dehydrogenase/glutarate-semialdehyde dehydrogenase
MVFINGATADEAELPFGGIRRSRCGRELGSPGIEESVHQKLVRVIA